MLDADTITSSYSRAIETEGTSVGLAIFRLPDEVTWTLAVFDEAWNATVWQHKFATEKDALATGMAAIRSEGIWSFVYLQTGCKSPPSLH